MKILVTNDDGIGAEGLVALAAALAKLHEVWVFAPDSERSGVSHALTLGNPVRVRRLADKEYCCSGTPSDCVVLARLGAIGFQPDLVVSGINRGSNLGTDIVYSGTCGAAREAVLNGLPGIAVSCASREKSLRYGAAASFVARHLERLIESCPAGAFINVNAPSSDADDLPGEWSSPCSRVYGNELRSFEAPDGSRYCFLAGEDVDVLESCSSDYHAVIAGRVSVSPILVSPQVPARFESGREFV
jgi:5''/3''-nucleotidase SurE